MERTRYYPAEDIYVKADPPRSKVEDALCLLQSIAFLAANRPLWDDLTASSIELNPRMADSLDVVVRLAQHGRLGKTAMESFQGIVDKIISFIKGPEGLKFKGKSRMLSL